MYIGSTTLSFHSRWCAHYRDLRKGKHINRYLQRAWNKYGGDKFEFSILAVCEPDKCLAIEQKYLDDKKAANQEYGYNISPTAGNTRGVVKTEETKNKLRVSIKASHARPEVIALRAAIRNDPEFKARHAAAMKVVMSKPEYRQKMSESVRLAQARPEVKAKVSAGIRRAYAANPDYKKKVIAASTGRKHTEKSKAKISAWQNLPESKARNRATHLGKLLSDETRAKISSVMKEKCAKIGSEMSAWIKKGWIGRREKQIRIQADGAGQADLLSF